MEFEAHEIVVFTEADQQEYPCFECYSIMMLGDAGKPHRLGINEEDIPQLIKNLAAAVGLEVPIKIENIED
jgi:hypothetical protein